VGLAGQVRDRIHGRPPQAADATNGTNFVSSCESALLFRRLWAIPLVVIGSVAFIGMMLATALESLREAMPAQADGN
jgi:hypothetical protein